jgi:ABC-type transporter Mla MlaB component
MCPVEMLRILQATAVGQSGRPVERIALVGELRGDWVAEVGRTCRALLNAGKAVELDLLEVSFADAHGLALLCELASARVPFVSCSLFVAVQLETAENDV